MVRRGQLRITPDSPLVETAAAVAGRRVDRAAHTGTAKRSRVPDASLVQVVPTGVETEPATATAMPGRSGL